MNETKNEIKELWPGQSIDLLKTLHILTKDGRLNQDSKRKLKQIHHLIQLIDPHLTDAKSIVDLGAGKSYLGFMLYDLKLREKEDTHVWAVEKRPELVETCKKIATTADFKRMTFVPNSIQEAWTTAEIPASVDAVCALHACDTATDEAIAFALKRDAKVIALVPCCQAEVARLLEKLKPSEQRDLESLWSLGIHRREFGSHLTNVIRALFLEAKGYKVRVTELIGWEHSMKNELILATRHQRSNPIAQKRLDGLLRLLPVDMKLFEMVSP